MTGAAPVAGPGVHRSNLPDLTVELAQNYGAMNTRRDELKKQFEGLPAKIETDEQLQAARDAVTGTNALLKDADKARENEKAPYLKGSRDVDSFFNSGIRDPLNPLKAKATDAVADYLERERLQKEAAAQAAAKEAAANAERLANEAATLEQEGRIHEADSKLAAAVHHEGAAAAAEAFSGRSVADQSRVGLGGGGVASVRKVTEIQSMNRAQLDLESLRPFFKEDHLLDAVKAFMKTGRTDLKGVVFTDKAKATIR